MLKNEQTRAVGNMGVNARGDVLDSTNKRIQERSSKVNVHYRKQIIDKVIDAPVGGKVTREGLQIMEINDIDGLDNINSPPVEKPTAKKSTAKKPMAKASTKSKAKSTEEKSSGGLASAIAKAREVEQQKLKTPKQEERSKKGVNKL